MGRRLPGTSLAALGALAGLAGLATPAGACNRDPYGMLRQKRPRAYGATDFFEDRRVMRTPPAGTVSQASPDLPDEVMTGLSGGQPLSAIPVPVTLALLQRGRHDFQIWCAACHGMLGTGASVPASKMALRPPPSIIAKARKPGELYRVIALGYGLMPSYAGNLGPVERWGVVAYVEALRRSQNATLRDVPSVMRPALENSP